LNGSNKPRIELMKEMKSRKSINKKRLFVMKRTRSTERSVRNVMMKSKLVKLLAKRQLPLRRNLRLMKN
jgi:hypothetical protein